MKTSITKNILTTLAVSAITLVLYTFGLSVHSLLTLLSAVLIVFVFAQNALMEQSWYQSAATIVAALYVPGTIVNISVHAHADASIQIFSVLLFHVFLVRTSVVNMNKVYQIIVRSGLFLNLIGLGCLLVFPFDSEEYLYPNKAFSAFAILSTLLLLAYAFVLSEQRQKEFSENLIKEKSTVSWFSTLVNLVSHNLRSPLATVISNTQLLQVKHPSVKDSEEIHRIITSVQTSNEIINRLLKATFVTDRNSTIELVESLKLSYPQLKIIGAPRMLTYEENVSILLGLEVFVDNAFRYSQEKVMVTFNDNRIEIRDYGVGLSEAEIEAFGKLKESSLGSLHGIGIPFAIRILDTIDYVVSAQNCDPGLLVVIEKRRSL